MTHHFAYRLRQLAAIFLMLMTATLGACGGGGGGDSGTTPPGNTSMSEADASLHLKHGIVIARANARRAAGHAVVFAVR